jgi:Fe2+ or Zn2+ uptake regulation protein
MEIPLNANIKDVGIPNILVYLNRKRKTGTLVIKMPAFTKKVYLDKGDVIFASSTDEDDRLGETLIKMGKITLEQYNRSVELLKMTGKRQGEILVELGYLTPQDIIWGVKYQAKDIIYSLFQLKDAEYEFREGEIPSNEVITLKMSMGNLIYEGVKRINNINRMLKEMPDMNSVLKLSADPVSLFQDIVLSSLDKKMLFMIDGKKTLKELINSSSPNSFQVMKTLYVLWSTGILEEKEDETEKASDAVSLEDILKAFHEEEETLLKRVDGVYSNLNSLNASELLEINEQSDAEAVKNNYYKLVKEFHPDRYLTIADSSMKDKVIAILEAITKAYSFLKEDDKRRDYFHKQRLITRLNGFLDALKKRRDGFFESLERV